MVVTGLAGVLSLLVRAVPASSASVWVPDGSGTGCVGAVGDAGDELLA
jgi:hypothetical protein